MVYFRRDQYRKVKFLILKLIYATFNLNLRGTELIDAKDISATNISIESINPIHRKIPSFIYLPPQFYHSLAESAGINE